MSLWWIVLLVGVLIVWALINRSSRNVGAPPRQEEPSAPLVARESSAPAWPEPKTEGLREPVVELPRVEPIAPLQRDPVVPLQCEPAVPLQRETIALRRTLGIELIPYPMSGKNARAVLSKEAWQVVREIVHEEHDQQCDECTSKENLECHEVWNYGWVTRASRQVPVMKLVGLRSLCRRCHQGKHIKYVEKKKPDQLPDVRRHLMALYGLGEQQLNDQVAEAVARVKRLKTRRLRELDLTYLNHARFAEVRTMMGRPLFSANELQYCRESELDS